MSRREPPAPAPRSRRGALLAAGAVVVALAAGGVVFAITRSGGDGSGAGATPESKASPTESYPVCTISVMMRTGWKNPARPPRTEAEAKAAADRVSNLVHAPGADFEAIARAESDDQLSGADGGFSDFVTLWDYNRKHHFPAMVEAAARLAIGEVSEPVRIGDGFVILKRLSREDGKRLESRSIATVDGLVVAWHDLDSSAPHTQTKDMAFAAASTASANLKRGLATLTETMSGMFGVGGFSMALRKGIDPSYGALAEAALASAPETWLDPIETPRGWAVVRRRAYIRCIVRHVLVTHASSVKTIQPTARTIDEAAAIANAALARIRKDRSSWDTVVEEVSEDKRSKHLGGFLGEYCSIADPDHAYSPEMEEAIRALAPGEVSEVTPTRYGLHVFWRVD